MKYLFVTLSVIALLIGGCKKGGTPCQCKFIPDNSNQLWIRAQGSDTNTHEYPDIYANYFLYKFDRTHMKNVGLRISGFFPAARYMSFNLYDENYATSLNSLLDVDIQPCCTGQNPYSGTRSFGNNDVYTIEVLPSGTNTSGKQNVLLYDQTIDSVTIILRYYLPAGSMTGGVPLPNIQAFDIPSGDSLPTPPVLNSNHGNTQQTLLNYVSQFYAMGSDTNLSFYNISLNGFYNNIDNQYLALPITPQTGEIYVLRFKAPAYATTASKNGTAEVRYWSINQGDDYTKAYCALKDADAHVAADGYVNLVIANFDSATSAKANGLNKMSIQIPSGTKMFLVYRNLVTRQGFSGNISQVPVLKTTDLTNYTGFRANTFIGDFAPIGKRMSRQDFLNNFGGVQVSY